MSGASEETISDAVRRALSQRGPLTEDELSDALRAAGIDLGPDAEQTLADVLDEGSELVLPLADERWVWLPGLLSGRIFTHRLTATEAEHDLIEYGPDVAPLLMLTESEDYQRLTDGSSVTDVSPFLDADLLAERGAPRSAVGEEGALCSARRQRRSVS